ncbi:NADH-quinone oxidoreductase subunit D [Granulicoccus phenolivorans]|uniref:NADH-quinone oxidoreductase subunit D-related protein n=1 Tax=Granulicoccus phenolivorans TaxID=266854 RepID=UPI000AD5FC39|nr:NADH-quinone oxidoreductase subunit D [Granulicoccus phenolivorans]
MPPIPAIRSLPTRFTVGSPATALPTAASVRHLDPGPEHPSRAGVLTLAVDYDAAGRISTAEVSIGLLHRGVEKLFEVRDYRQILSLANRHDWQAPAFGELAVALAAEQLLGLEVPRRAVWLRTLLSEHTRLVSHLGSLSWLAPPQRLGHLRALRERLREQLRRWTGNRIHPMVVRIGGVIADVGSQWLATEVALADEVAAFAAELSGALQELPTGLGILSPAQVDSWGLSGPVSAASGVDRDLRRRRPYLAYAELADLLPTAPETTRDARARLSAVAAELPASAALIRACAEQAPGGVITVTLPKILKLPVGDCYVATAAPWGQAGVHLVSTGQKTPARLQLRTPSSRNVAALESALLGADPDQVLPILCSLGYVIGDVAK